MWLPGDVVGEFSTDDTSVLYVSLDGFPVDDPSESSADPRDDVDDTEDDALRRPFSVEMSGAL